MTTAIKKIGTFYAKLAKTGLIFALGFFAGIAFTGVLLGMAGYKLDAGAMPAGMSEAVALSPS